MIPADVQTRADHRPPLKMVGQQQHGRGIDLINATLVMLSTSHTEVEVLSHDWHFYLFLFLLSAITLRGRPANTMKLL